MSKSVSTKELDNEQLIHRELGFTLQMNKIERKYPLEITGQVFSGRMKRTQIRNKEETSRRLMED